MLLFLFIGTLSLLLLLRIRKNNCKFPPGPIGLPIVGNLIGFGRKPLRSLLNWKKQYGNIVGLQLGSFRTVVISDITLLKEAFNSEAFNGRPNFRPAFLFTGGDEHGTLTSNGNEWDEVRRFTVKNLNRLGFGKKSTECLIQNDIDELIFKIENMSKISSVAIHDELYIPVSKHLWYLLTGDDISPELNPKFRNILVELHESLWKPIGSPIWFMPWLIDWFPHLTGWEKLKETILMVHDLVSETLTNSSRKKTPLNSAPNLLNLIDSYREKISENQSNHESNFHDKKGNQHMRGMTLNLFVTAAEALSNTLNWALIYLSIYPNVQEKVFEEILAVIGKERNISLLDQQDLPYINAFMKEVYRISSTSPFSNFQSTTQDINFHGYFIPKDTAIIGNLYGIHHDEEIWGDPEVFRPERFLIDNNKTQKEVPQIIPFSIGMRTCLGRTYANNVFFLFITRLCQKFTFEIHSKNIPTADELIDESHVSIFRFAKFYEFNIKVRT